MKQSDIAWMNPENMIEELEKLAEARTPEWKLDLEHPDIGTVLALLFADMMADTARRFTQAVKLYPMRLYNMLGEKLLPSGEAEGYLTFQTVNEEVSGSYISGGTEMSGMEKGKDAVFFKTGEDIFVSPARFQGACYVDGEKDFISQFFVFPVKERELVNKQSHTCFIGHSFLFQNVTEGDIILDFRGLPHVGRKLPSEASMEKISWSYYSDDGFISFAESRYEEGRLYLYKRRKMPVPAQMELQEQKSFWLRGEAGALKPGEEIVFPGLTLSAEGRYLEPDVVYNGSIELDAESFLPFGNRPYVYQELYICSDEVFSKKGAQLLLSFDLKIMEYPSEYKSPELPVQWKNIMRSTDFKRADPVDVIISSVSFEYYNGLGFTRLPGTKNYEGIFGEGAKEGPIELAFSCPEDIYPCLVAARTSWCIRIRIFELSSLYAVDGVYKMPKLTGCRLSYSYESGGKAPERFFCENRLQMERLQCVGENTPFFNSFPKESMLYLSFSRPLKEERISLLFLLEESRQELAAPCRYEFYGKNGWGPLKVFDGTLSLSRTGVLTFLTSQTFVKKEFFHKRGYWVRIVWEGEENQEKNILPLIQGIFINSVAVQAEPGSGERGNLPAGAEWNFERTIGFVNKAENRVAISGGYNKEEAGQAARRNAAELRHRERAVTARDLEDIVKGRIRNIFQVKCFSGRNELGEKAFGHIVLAVLLQDKNANFNQMKKKIYDCLRPYMDDRIIKEGRLHIIEPDWVSIKVHVTLAAKASARSWLVRENAENRIHEFLDPVTGNFDKKGWQIGTLPSSVQIANACEQMEDVLYVKHISLDKDKDDSIYALAAGGKHEIVIETEGESWCLH